MKSNWAYKRPDLRVPYDPAERVKYLRNESSVYHADRWFLQPVNPERQQHSHNLESCEDYYRLEYGGRAKFGEFPLVVVRRYFRKKGYTVWASEPRLLNPLTLKREGYAAVSYPGTRNPKNRYHYAYRRMLILFGGKLVAVNKKADKAKQMAGKVRHGGDPDLFVFKKGNPTDCFFVEVKDKDTLKDTQRLCFPLMERYLCPVKLAQIYRRPIGLSGAEVRRDLPIKNFG